nr:trypsin-like peptidase domain-containing protein [Nocardioides daedukensis]
MEQSGASPEDPREGPQTYAPPAPGAVPAGRPAPGYAGPSSYAPHNGPSTHAPGQQQSAQAGQPGQFAQPGPSTGLPPTQRPDAGQHQGMGGYGPAGGYGPGNTAVLAPQHAQGPGQPPATRTRDTKVLPGWFWPVLCAMTLVLGLMGGALGALVIDKTNDPTTSGRTNGGLADVTTVTDAPLPKDGSVAAVAKSLLPSTVQIIAESSGEGATGSGFFLDKEGHVVTNNHVVASAADGGKIQIVDHKRKRHDATVVGRSPVYDLAILYVEGLEDVTPASLGTSADLNVGETVVAIGSPLGLDSTVTSGIVSALNRPVTTGNSQDDQSYINAVQTDAAINPGNSGGPLVDLEGRVIGVNSAIATTGGGLGGESGNIGVGFAIPIEQVITTADQILKNGKAQYPVIGAQVQSDKDGRGAKIAEVMKGQPAEEAGLKKNDIVTALDGRAVTDSPSLIVAIRAHVPGDTVTLTVDRGGKEMELKVELEGQVG